MKQIFFFCLLLVLFSCKKEKAEAFITINPAEIAPLTSQASTFKVNVTLNSEWTVVPSQSWCKVSPESGGSGTTELTVSIAENTTDVARAVVLTFKSGTSKKGFTITQNKFLPQVIFVDEAFKNYCITNFDTDKDGGVSIEEAKAVSSINVSGLDISSLEGIENFVSLKALNCSDNNLVVVNLIDLGLLTSLNCSNNQLTTLDIESNINLTTLDCTGNPFLAKINVWTGFQAPSSYSKPSGASYVEPETATPVGYSLVWQDEFNDPREGGKAVLPSATNWSFETGNHGWGNNELQNYVAGISGTDTCAKIYNRSLKIVAKKVGSQVLSVRMNSTQSWLYGYFEARLKLPVGKGTWPAFWMLPKNFTAWPDDGEIDIMEEVGYNPNYISSSIHCKAYYHSIGTQKTAEKHVPTAQTEFHVYAVEWTEDFIKGYIDGVKYFEFNNDHQGNKNTWPFNVPFYLKLNLAWGGNWGGAQGVDETCLPATYEVDYVRVFQKK